MARISSFALRSSGEYETNKSKDAGEKKDLWSSMLDGVSTEKRLPQKTVLVLGGQSETQRDFLESLNADSSKKRHLDKSKVPPVANQFALGYTYQDVFDADHEDILARLSIYFLNEPAPSFRPLAKPLLTTQSLPNMLLVILLDWNEPWKWLRQVRDWIRFLRSLLVQLDDECKDTLEENIKHWRNAAHGPSDTTTGSSDEPNDVQLGPGEWDEPLGIPLCVVCQNADKIESLEQERGWKEEEFDLVLQYLRTVLLKHGASLIYTMPSQPGSLPAVIHSWLGIQETSKISTLKHNVVDRDRVLIPPYWDSWGKIRLLREGFDIEQVSRLWSEDISSLQDDEEAEPQEKSEEPHSPKFDSVSWYETSIKNPTRDPLAVASLGGQKSDGVEVQIMANQEFLKEQADALEKLRLEDEETKKAAPSTRQPTRYASYGDSNTTVSDHIGQVNFNMGGIQVDAEEMLNKINNREAERATENGKGIKTPEALVSPTKLAPTDPADNEQLKTFFAGLLKKPSSVTNSPRS